MAHDDTEKAQLLNDIFTAARSLASVLDNTQRSLRVTFNPAALTSAATQSGTWNAGSVASMGDTTATSSMNDANLNQDSLNFVQAFTANTVRS
jgi:hypothetical protein